MTNLNTSEPGLKEETSKCAVEQARLERLNQLVIVSGEHRPRGVQLRTLSGTDLCKS